MPVGYKMADLRLQKKKPGLFEDDSMLSLTSLLFRPIRSSLGLSNARICYSTGGILSPDAFRFYQALESPSQEPVWDNRRRASYRRRE